MNVTALTMSRVRVTNLGVSVTKPTGAFFRVSFLDEPFAQDVDQLDNDVNQKGERHDDQHVHVDRRIVPIVSRRGVLEKFLNDVGRVGAGVHAWWMLRNGSQSKSLSGKGASIRKLI